MRWGAPTTPYFVFFGLLRITEIGTPIYTYCYILTLRPSPKMLFQGDTPEGSDTFQWPVIGRDRVGGFRPMGWDKVKVPL